MKKPLYILKAWVKALGWATHQELVTSEYRLKICKKCPHKRSNWFYNFCNLCGCPLYPKSFSKDESTGCPIKRW